MPIPQQLPVAIYEQEVPPICPLLFSLFCGTRHKSTLLAPSCVCELWQHNVNNSAPYSSSCTKRFYKIISRWQTNYASYNKGAQRQFCFPH